ncbi:MAG TPA: hypothetical protein PLI90_13165, partial [Rhodocyclaceae bacterium]|nr:hypothetical protein [Rhodocyclaceae bacterium]
DEQHLTQTPFTQNSGHPRAASLQHSNLVTVFCNDIAKGYFVGVASINKDTPFNSYLCDPCPSFCIFLAGKCLGDGLLPSVANTDQKFLATLSDCCHTASCWCRSGTN